jgi:polysaccharide export outer membrane protein
MAARKIISILLAFLIFLPPIQGWSQPLEDQAQFYLQKIGPGQAPSTQSGPLPATQSPKSELPQQVPTPAQPAQVLTAAPRQPEDISTIERRAWAQRMYVKQFGYSFFYQPPASFLPMEAIPVGPDYVIGPGDRIKLIIWGSVQGEYNLTVDRNGQINIPKVGAVHVSSLTYRQLREVLDREFSRQFTNFQMNVTLDNLRTIQIYIVGQARFPGSYAVSSLSTLVSALFAAGGPSKSGSLRNIQIKRGNRVAVNFDMYDFLLRGDKSKDIRLQPEDVIFIPPIGPMVAIGSPKTLEEAQEAGQKLAMSKGMDSGGAVKVPAIYELKNEKTLDDLLRLAGGLGDTAFKGRVQVLRIKGHHETVLFDEDLAKILSKYHGMSLIDGDFVMIFPVSAVVERKVTIAGAVKSPGEFGFRDNMRIRDLVNYAGGLLMQANKEEAELTRVRITPQGPETSRIYVRLYQALSGASSQNMVLQPNDYLFIRMVPDWGTYKTVQIEGEANFPGTYTIKKGEMLSSLLTRAGGFTDKAYLLGGVLIRESTRALQKQQLHAAINRLEARSLVSAGQKAAGAVDSEDAKSAEATARQQQMLIATLRKVEPLGRVVIHLEDPERLRGTPDDIALQEGDRLVVPQSPGTVNVVGAVFAPTALVYTPYRTVKEYLTMAGGTTEIADDKEIYVIKVNGAAVSRKGFSWLKASWDGARYAYHPGGINSLTLDPGDTIVVPEQLERIAWLKNFKDIASILGNIALTAGIAFVALK